MDILVYKLVRSRGGCGVCVICIFLKSLVSYDKVFIDFGINDYGGLKYFCVYI